MNHHGRLRDSGVVDPRRQGQHTFYRLTETRQLLARAIKKGIG